ncbi:MAG: transcription elongation factor Spt5 [Candidatus Pacearchaeota archaeon]|nr:transcription elongation factor Spt5 [Candidatus Pacearchaeota archaeon]
MIFVIKVTTNKEDHAIDLIAERAEKRNLNVFSVARPYGLRGYVLLEAADTESAEQAIYNLPYVKNLIMKPISYKEIESMMQPVAATINIEKGDIVEMLTEPFKREKAKVTRVDKTREEVVVELLEAAVPIPITMKIDNVKVIRRGKSEGENGESEGETKEK